MPVAAKELVVLIRVLLGVSLSPLRIRIQAARKLLTNLALLPVEDRETITCAMDVPADRLVYLHFSGALVAQAVGSI